MPIFGTADADQWLAHAADMPDLATDAVTLPGAKTLMVIYEIDDSDMEGLVPPALHPTIPPTMHVLGISVDDSPLGAFTIAIVRVGCRAAVRPRGIPTRVVCDDETAARVLARRWGFPATVGDVVMRERYDRVELSVDDGASLAAQLVNPIPIGNGDLLYTAGMHVANVAHEGDHKPWLVQVDPEFEVSKADRGQARIDNFNPTYWNAEYLTPTSPIVASYTTANITLPKIRYIADPTKPAFQGTVTVNRG